MPGHALRRLLLAVPTLLFISLVVFLLLEAAPSDPLGSIPLTVPPEVRAAMREAMGLDRPWPLRYLMFLRQLLWIEPLHGLDSILGTTFAEGMQRIVSYQSRAPVMTTIAERLPQTLAVVGLSYLLGIVVALPIGVFSALRPRGWFDRIAGILTMLGFAVPSFFTGVVLILVFSVWLGWLPSVYDTTLRVTGWDSLLRQLQQMAMPVAVLTLYNAAQIGRFLRAAMLENLAQDHVRAARAKGLPEHVVIVRHVLRNSLIPAVTVIAMGVPQVFAGAIITEQIFRVNGLGQLLILAINAGDMPMVMVLTVIFATLIVLFTLIADLLYALLDPRLRHG